MKHPGVAYLLSYTVSVEKLWTQNTRIIHDVWRLLILSNEEKTNDYENFVLEFHGIHSEFSYFTAFLMEHSDTPVIHSVHLAEDEIFLFSTATFKYTYRDLLRRIGQDYSAKVAWWKFKSFKRIQPVPVCAGFFICIRNSLDRPYPFADPIISLHSRDISLFDCHI
jgi:hypothetical protein